MSIARAARTSARRGLDGAGRKAVNLFAALVVTLSASLGSSQCAVAQTQFAVEYYNAGWDHYFVTSFPEEIAVLDGGAFGGTWKRTGQTFSVWSQPVGGALPTCRFFGTAFAPKSSHFYTPFASECASVRGDPNWQFESIAFYLQLPDANGVCPASSTPVFRLYNNGSGGAPNHRYTTSIEIFNQMRAAGWIMEGHQTTGVFACAPPTVSATAPGGRVVVSAKAGEVVQFPAYDQSWLITYAFRVPPLPSGGWDPSQHTFYVWGDVDFDRYGANGTHKISDYIFNQIAPEIFIGRVLSANDANFVPSWTQLNSWAMQAQYFWQKGDTPYAQTGPIVYINPGEEITTTIRFDSSTGKVTASISAPNGTSTIVIDRPFPNEPALFANWSDFFKRAQQKSGSPFIDARPVLNVEPYANQQTVCSVLPFMVDLISIPGIVPASSEFVIGTTGGQSCPNPMVMFDFDG
jgi:hypothetical protein